jgi:dTDP-4-amino-4,6-dideoxygalactose transaminase
MRSLPITLPSIDAEDLEAVTRPLRRGWLVQGEEVTGFEAEFCAWTQAPHAVATTSCTTAMQLALAALQVRPGDEVIVPAFTWVATPNVVEHLGARAVFVDIDLATFNLDVGQVEARVSPRTVGILPVHLFGHPAPLDRLEPIVARHGLWMVEDAACGFDAWSDGRHVGMTGRFGCFSFHPRKAITTGEGGMILARDAADANRLRTLRDHGAGRSDHARHHAAHAFQLPAFPELGFNFRMTDIQAALGRAQLAKANRLMAERRCVAKWYDGLLAEFDWLRRPTRDPRHKHGNQSYVCLLQPEPLTLAAVPRVAALRLRLMAWLESRGISTRPGTHAPPFLEVYQARYATPVADLPNAWVADQCSIALPLAPSMTQTDCERVAEALRDGMAACWTSTF